jgi:Clostridium epsilon toxin ETX/Bacillus mosquitocidal toxin MTX2
MSPTYIPDAKAIVRIQGMQSGKVLIDDSKHGLSHAADASPPAPNAWWHIVPGTGGNAGKYMVQNDVTKRVLWCRTKEARAGTIDDGGKYPDNWFTIEEGEGQYTGHFRLLCPATQMVIVSRTSQKPEVDGFHASQKYEDQYFQLLFEDMSLEHLEYHLHDGKITSTQPYEICRATLNNNSSEAQTLTFTTTNQKTETHTFEYSAGFKITVGVTFNWGVPAVSGGSLSATVEQNNDLKWGTTTTTQSSWGIDRQVKVGPHSKMLAIAKTTQATLDVPFTATWTSKLTKATFKTDGVYKGVAFDDITVNYEQK